MPYFADLHIHSHRSLATSSNLTPEHLHLWGIKKGIQLIGTGDFTHPAWLEELSEKITPAENGFYNLKDAYILPEAKIYQASSPQFVPSAEISNIYKKNGRVRKVHNILLSPDLQTAALIQAKLQALGFNIRSDGRPILGLDSRDLFELVLSINPACILIPAHIWTPWFSALGASSGFDSIAECYGDLTQHIFAVETGLSSDVPMNRILSQLDAFTLVSNSDAHSPEKLGRNANIIHGEYSWQGLVDALKKGLVDTIDLFPQEGKYHYAGHRKCGVVLNPVEAARNHGLCPVCRRKLTPGVMDRVIELADRSDPIQSPRKQSFNYIIPLPEILAELAGVSPSTKQVASQYQQIIKNISPELPLLLNSDIDALAAKTNPMLAEAIRRMRSKQVIISEGFDGEYGTVKVFHGGEAATFSQKQWLFESPAEPTKVNERPLLNFDLQEYFLLKNSTLQTGLTMASEPKPLNYFNGINKEQEAAIGHVHGPAFVVAGPGAGKTHVFAQRIAHLIKNKHCQPENILAVTFTNKAANEIKQRLIKSCGPELSDRVKVGTFHAIGLDILSQNPMLSGREAGFVVINERERIEILSANFGLKSEVSNQLSLYRNGALNLLPTDPLLDQAKAYEEYLIENNLIDFDDLVVLTNNLFQNHPSILTEYRARFTFVLVDEYQDVNPIQYQFLTALCKHGHKNLFAIGDPNQSIYGFRGANPKFIQQFFRDFEPVTNYQLSLSYRCPDTILRASANVIGQTGFLSGLEKGLKIKIVANATDLSEAEFIARSIDASLGGTRFFAVDSGVASGSSSLSPSSIAILCRTSKQFPAICKALDDHAIPWQTSKLVEKPTLTERIGLLYKQLLAPQNYWLNKQFRKEFKEDFPCENFKQSDSVAYTLGMMIEKYFKNLKNNELIQIENLVEMAKSFGSDHEGFSTFLGLDSADSSVIAAKDAVNVLTLHASKGLEFEHVYIAGCEDRLVPYRLFKGTESPIDEEKRLLYVGMTRARTQLFLTHALRRRLFNMNLALERSPFLDQIEKELIQKEKHELKPRQNNQQLELF